MLSCTLASTVQAQNLPLSEMHWNSPMRKQYHAPPVPAHPQVHGQLLQARALLAAQPTGTPQDGDALLAAAAPALRCGYYRRAAELRGASGGYMRIKRRTWSSHEEG